VRSISRFALVCFAALTVFANLQELYPSSYQARSQEASPVFRGNWTATSGSQVFRGTWSAQTSANNPNKAVGSWTLLNDSGEIFLQGTWSASKARPGWQGTWTARTSSGRSFSGTWASDLHDLSAKTFQEMLERTRLAEVSGSWKSGQQRGNWWLKH
jgi:hypothetical protein